MSNIKRQDNKLTINGPEVTKLFLEYEESDVPQGGYYSVCLDNQFSRFSAKLVNLYLTTFRYDEWEKFSQELQDMDVTVENFTSTLRSVDQRVQVASAKGFNPISLKIILFLSLQIIRQFQAMSKGTEARDFNIIQGNFNYVQNWSMAQILVVIICTIVQVSAVDKSIYNVILYTLNHESITGEFCEKFVQRSKRPKEWWRLQNEDIK